MHQHQLSVPVSFPAATWLTDHAAERCAQRRLSPDDLAYVMRHGTHTRTAQADHFFLRNKDIPVGDRRIDHLARLASTVVIMNNGEVITAYRTHAAPRAIRKKSKWTLRRPS